MLTPRAVSLPRFASTTPSVALALPTLLVGICHTAACNSNSALQSYQLRFPHPPSVGHIQRTLVACSSQNDSGSRHCTDLNLYRHVLPAVGNLLLLLQARHTLCDSGRAHDLPEAVSDLRAALGRALERKRRQSKGDFVDSRITQMFDLKP